MHPHSKRGTSTKLDPDVIDKKANWQGTPDQFPPVLVHSLEQEEEHLAKGYYTQGTSSPAAFAATFASPPPPNYEPQEYPKWMGDVLVLDEEHERELLSVEGDEEDKPAPRGRPRKVA
jgi:hypothetical protein